MLREKYGEEEMKLIFEPDDLSSFEAQYREQNEIRKRFSNLKGTVIEPTQVEVAATNGCYPLEALIQGVAWPKDVDPAKRETYLSDDDFCNVFRMSRSSFNDLDKFKRMRLKKEYGLF
jgi:hypothetical protein